jgi:UDP-3-O-[3-hydroxymyristoyl] glucosamine N-acyltransferase
MRASLALLAELVHGRLVTDAGAVSSDVVVSSVVVSGAAPLGEAGAGDITFLDAADKAPLLQKSAAAAAVVPHGVACPGRHVIEVADVHEAFVAIHRYLQPPRVQRRIGISPAAHISPSARLAEEVDVHPGATIGDEVEIGPGSTIHSGTRVMAGCKIGGHVTLFPNVVLYEDTAIGDHVIIHAGAVLGAFGFGYRFEGGRHHLAAQLGNVIIESHVEIGACTTIDRGTYGATRIREGSKLDNQVMIGHNCQIGRHNLLCSHVGIAGSTTTGDYVVMAGQVGVRDHVHIGDGVQLGPQSGVRTDLPPGGKYLGTPAVPVREHMELYLQHIKLPEIRRQVRELAKTVEELQRRMTGENRSAA